MDKQVFYPSVILRITIFMFGIVMAIMLFDGGVSDKVFFTKAIAFMGALLFGVGGILVPIFCFHAITVTDLYVQIGSRPPIKWKHINKIKLESSQYRYSKFLFIDYKQLVVNKDNPTSRPYVREDRSVIFLTFLSNPQKLLAAMDRHFHITQNKK